MAESCVGKIVTTLRKDGFEARSVPNYGKPKFTVEWNCEFCNNPTTFFLCIQNLTWTKVQSDVDKVIPEVKKGLEMHIETKGKEAKFYSFTLDLCFDHTNNYLKYYPYKEMFRKSLKKLGCKCVSPSEAKKHNNLWKFEVEN